MHVSLTHSEEVQSSKRHYYLTASITFSEAEKHVIRARNLEGLPVISGKAIPPAGFFKFMSPALGGFGPLLILGGFVLGLFGAFATNSPVPGLIGWLLILGGIGLWIWSWIGDRVLSAQHDDKTYTAGSVMRNPDIRLWSDDPVGTKLYEQQLRTNLQSLKRYIDASVDLGGRQRFEV